ncbi:MAG TPA: NmrA family transcriptional regulator [Solirubrobacteraceae bacterium]|nr:NmrA family transcriptional regulator [Solirubrobacteraceae bacterium]
MSNSAQDITQDTTLVVGATGKTGRRVAERLLARGITVRAGSRTAVPAFDWEDRSTWGPVLDGISAAYVSFFPDLAVPGAAETVGAFAAEAAERGVGRLVLLSGRGEEEARRTERALAAAGPAWTVVRASWFSQNFSESFLLEPVLDGEVALPADGVPEPFVDAEDIADVAVAALTGDGHDGQVYEVTGPRALTFAAAVGEIAAATGRPLRYEPVTIDAFAAGLAEQGVPDDVAGLMRYLFTEVLDGRNAAPADGVRRALGRPPRDFADYARATAATGAWAAPARAA